QAGGVKGLHVVEPVRRDGAGSDRAGEWSGHRTRPSGRMARRRVMLGLVGGSAVPLSDFILRVFVLVDDLLKELFPGRLRGRGPCPVLSDSEVITVELVGEFLGLDHDKGLFAHFRRHYSSEFPGLLRVSRTTFARQAANLFAVKRSLHRHLAARLAGG